MIIVGLVLAVLFQALWFLITWGMGNKLGVISFPSLRGYENYAFYSLPIAFVLYLTFSVLGAFAEEVTYRGYVQSRISSRYGYIVGILISTLLFSLQHIHIFQLNWIERFFQTQFIYVIFFGVFVGYLFFKSKENIWSVFAFHALMNIFNVSLPIQVTNASPFSSPFATIISFILLILVLRFIPSGHESFSTA